MEFVDREGNLLQVGDVVKVVVEQGGGAHYGGYMFKKKVKPEEVFVIEELVYLEEMAARYPTDPNLYTIVGYNPERDDNSRTEVISTKFIVRIKTPQYKTLIQG